MTWEERIGAIHYFEEVETAVKEAGDYCKLAIEALKKEQVTGHWIPISERLPEEDAKVLTTIKWKDGSRYVGIDSIVGGKWMLNIPEDGDTTIAWMPLPKPYEPQESEE